MCGDGNQIINIAKVQNGNKRTSDLALENNLFSWQLSDESSSHAVCDM